MIDFERINKVALPQFESLLREWLPGGRREGFEYVVRNPRRSDKNPGSFKVNVKTGFWSDFAGSKEDSGGDPIALLAYLKNCKMGEAAKEIANRLGLEPGDPNSKPYQAPAPLPEAKSEPEAEKWRALPVGRSIPGTDFMHPKHGKPVSAWAYRNAEGEILQWVARYDLPDGKKDVIPWTYCELMQLPNVKQWRRQGLPKPRPLFNLDRLAQRPAAQVLIVEGEKTAEKAQEIIPSIIVVTWPGGGNGVRFADFTPLSGRTIAIWPDADEPGLKAAFEIKEILEPIAARVKVVAPPAGVSKGWDLADAHAEGWTLDRVIEHLRAPELIEVKKKDPPPPSPPPQKSEQQGPPAYLDETPFPDEVPPDLQEPEEDDMLPNLSGKHSHDSAALARYMRSRVLYDEYLEQWFRFSTIWRPVSEGSIKHELIRVMDERIIAGYNNSQVNGVFSMLSTRLARRSETEVRDSGIEVVSDAWNQDKNLLPLTNCVLDLRTGDTRSHSPSLFFNWMLPYAYDPRAECPTIDRFIHRLAGGDSDTEAVLYAFLAALVRGKSKLQKYLEVIGYAGTGKSILIKIAQALVGHANTRSTKMDCLSNRFETATFYGKKLIIFSDAAKYMEGVDVFKALTGGDPLRYEEKNVQPGQPFIYGGLVIVVANNPVQFDDHSTAMVRRRVPIHIDKMLDPKDQDPDIDLKISAELPGLLNRLLMLSDEEIASTLREASDLSGAGSRRSLIETNPVAAWLDERCVVDLTARTNVGCLKYDSVKRLQHVDEWLYPNYSEWLESVGRQGKMTLGNFVKALTEIIHRLGHKGVEMKKRNEGKFCYGVRLRRSAENVANLISGEHDED